jgi:transposase-like protein
VEVLSVYWNSQIGANQLKQLHAKALSSFRSDIRLQPTTRRQRRLRPHEVAQLIVGYESGAGMSDLAREFGIHRATVSVLLAREGVKPRKVGLTVEEITRACQLYRERSSLAKIGQKFGVDGMTVRRALLLSGVVMRSPNERGPCA